jgi:hypothetical protein
MFDRFFDWLRLVHDRYARVILAGIAALILPMMVMTTVATMDNWRQDDERDRLDADRDRLLACFDDYAAADSEASIKVREAAAAKDVAATARDTALRDISRLLLTDNNSESESQRVVLSLNRTSEDLVRAQARLDRARQKNPIPPPPSKFCGLD